MSDNQLVDVTAKAEERIAAERSYYEEAPPPQSENDYGVPSSEERERLSFTLAENVTPAIDAQDFVEGVLTAGTASVLYGEPGTGKTFLAADLGLKVSLGWSWLGRETEPGGVLYIAGEGGGGIRNRVAAFKHYHGITGSPPFALVTDPIALTAADAPAVARITETARLVAQQTGYSIQLIVVDTLSRALAGGDENSSQDMTGYIAAVDAIRQETGAHVMSVHHAGKDTTKGARGHSSLKAAVDTEIEVVRSDLSETASAKVRKQRDLPCTGEFPFRLEPLELGTDRRGKSVTSCVVEPAEDETPKGPKLNDRQQRALQALHEAVKDHGRIPNKNEDAPASIKVVDLDHWRNALTAADVIDPGSSTNPRRDFKRIRDQLHERHAVVVRGSIVWPRS